MKILFLSIGDIPSIRHHEIYPDLLREFIRNGNEVYVVCSREKRTGLPTELIEEDGAKLLKVHIGNITKTNLLEKGFPTLLVGNQYKRAIKKFFSNTKFDMIIYSTPPITLSGVVEYLKKRDNARTYLLLKDIFPQNAVDIGMMSTTGFKSFLYKHFRSQEKKLYKISDRIGCMSPANVEYVLNHNREVKARDNAARLHTGKGIVEVCPNSIEIMDMSVDETIKKEIRLKFGIPLDKTVFIYGGNLGKPQGIPFMIDCLKKCESIDSTFFIIVGDGTEAHLVQEYVEEKKPVNVKYLKRLPKADYDIVVGACDVGLIFLDHRFTIPNFPSRLLSYMQAKLPVLACTDPNTDIGKVIVNGVFGWWCESNDPCEFKRLVNEILNTNFSGLDQNAWNSLVNNYTVSKTYSIIMTSVDNC